MNILEEYREPSFGEKFGQAFANMGRTAATAIPEFMQQVESKKQQAAEMADINKLLGLPGGSIRNPDILKEMVKQKMKAQSLQDQYSMIFGKKAPGTSPAPQQPGMSPTSSQMGMGEESAQGEEDRGLLSMGAENISDQDILAASLVNPTLAKLMQDQKDAAVRPKSEKEKEYFKINEPKLMEVADSERKTQMEGARLDRLSELFSDPKKFPSGFTAAIFTRDGQIDEKAYALLSPEAQEALKLIIDMTSDIKDSYGSRVTNFDLQTFLKKLPGLMNSPEGKERVIRDLKKINEINQLYNRGIQDIFDQAGGSDKIPWSQAEKIFRKKYGKQLDSLTKEFVKPNQKSFKGFPTASDYLGQRIKDPKTGEIFISDGTVWKPVGAK
jgi:hypothetical protein